MKSFFNSWFIKYIVVFILVAIMLIGLLTGYEYFFDRYKYISESGVPITRIDNRTGEVYKFRSDGNGNYDWVLINESK